MQGCRMLGNENAMRRRQRQGPQVLNISIECSETVKAINKWFITGPDLPGSVLSGHRAANA